jgi:hypothetical protein
VVTHRPAAAVLALALLNSPAAGIAADPACAVNAGFEPARAIVGQQVLWRARISRRSDAGKTRWERVPSFPGLRAEWLPGLAEGARAQQGDAVFHQREEHRAVFAVRAGSFVIPGATLLCEAPANAGRAARTERIFLPPGELIVDELPSAGQPADFRGLVGPLTVQAHVDRERIELGESVRVSVMLLGAANLWDAAPPFQQLDRGDEVEMFRDPPTLDQQAGDKLYLRRAFRLDLVPKSEGPLMIPESRVAYYDPLSRSYGVAVAPALRVEVLPRGSLREQSSESRVGSQALPAAPEAPSSRVAIGVGAVALLLGFAGIVLVRRQRARGHSAPVDEALTAARDAGARGDAAEEVAAYTRALRAALAIAAPGLQQLDGHELRAHAGALVDQRPELLEAASVLAELDECRYASQVRRPAPDAVNAAIQKLQSAASRGTRR